MKFSLKSLLIVVAALAVILGGAREVFRMRRLADSFEYHVGFSPPGQFDGEQPVQRDPSVHHFVLPGLTKYLNSEACVGRMRLALGKYSVSKEWTVDNVAFSAGTFNASVPSQIWVNCRLPVPGHHEWSIAGAGSAGVDRERLPAFKEHFQDFVVDEIDRFRRELRKND